MAKSVKANRDQVVLNSAQRDRLRVIFSRATVQSATGMTPDAELRLEVREVGRGTRAKTLQRKRSR